MLSRWAVRLRIEIKDRLRYARVLQWGAGLLWWWRGRLSRDTVRRLDAWAKAFRLLAPLERDRGVTRALKPYVVDSDQIDLWRKHQIGWKKKVGPLEHFSISKGIVLKPYVSPQERGVILISFEYNWLPLLQLPQLEELLRRYALIGAPSWSPPPFPTIWSMAGLPNSAIFMMQSNFREADWYAKLPTNVATLPLLISHWIDPENYDPKPAAERDIDILMVANWAAFKRQFALFKALAQMPALGRVVVVGQPDSGRTVEHLKAEAAAYGVLDRVEFLDRLDIQAVTELQCRAKVSLVFSRREGSCVVVAESLFADCPVGLIEGAHIGSSAFINDQTGVFLRESHLAEDLTAFLARFETFSPRKWACESISCFRSASVMNEVIRDWSLKQGAAWTEDVVPFTCRPNPIYLDRETAARMEAEYVALRDELGVTIEGHNF